MTNKEFLQAMSLRLELPEAEIKEMTTLFVETLVEHLEDGESFNVQGFGVFEVKKKLERIAVSPSTKQRMLIPPKLVISFKPGPTLKEKFK